MPEFVVRDRNIPNALYLSSAEDAEEAVCEFLRRVAFDSDTAFEVDVAEVDWTKFTTNRVPQWRLVRVP